MNYCGGGWDAQDACEEYYVVKKWAFSYKY